MSHFTPYRPAWAAHSLFLSRLQSPDIGAAVGPQESLDEQLEKEQGEQFGESTGMSPFIEDFVEGACKGKRLLGGQCLVTGSLGTGGSGGPARSAPSWLRACDFQDVDVALDSGRISASWPC